MNHFQYSRASSLEDTIHDLATSPNSKVIAGGTNLLDLMKSNVENPDKLIDIRHLAFDNIEALPEGGLRLGAMQTNANTASNVLVERDFPLVSQAILAGASPQLRNMATNGGNLLQRTRCYYFYDISMPCNKRNPGSGCSAIKGFNRIHAILGASSECIATHPSDLCVALAAFDAIVNVTSSKGNRSIDFENFHRLPGDTPHLDHNLGPDEIITSIDLPPNAYNSNVHYLKIRDRQSYAFALVSVAAALTLEGDLIKDIRLVLGGVAHKPWRDRAAESHVVGKSANPETFRELAETVLSSAQSFGHNDYKIELAKRAIVTAFTNAIKQPVNI